MAALAGVLGLAMLLMPSLASAQPSPRTARQAPNGAPAEIDKSTLADTSIDAPSLWTTTSGTVRVVLAWTGVNAAHSLNLMTSSAGVHFGGKVTLADTSPYRPAVTRTSGDASGKVAIAWTGSDSAHTLNVLYDVYGTRRKLTLWGDTAYGNPALQWFNGALMLAWAGTDPAHTLNLWPIIPSASGLTTGQKVTLWGTGAVAPPSLSLDRGTGGLILTWAMTAPAQRITFATSTDGIHWPMAAGTPLAEWSGSTPSMIGIAATGMPLHYFAWTGIDPGHSLNVQWTEGFPSWPVTTVTKAVLSEQAFGAPSLGFIGGPGQVMMAWTGIDPGHSLNVATVAPWPSLPCTPPQGVQPVSSQVIVWGNTAASRKWVTLSFDAGGEDGVRAARLLDTLKARGIRSTWFLEGEWAQDHPDIVRRIVADSHEIGNHTVDHPDLTTPPRSNASICAELTLTDQIAIDLTGHGTRPFFRPPYGAYNDQVRSVAASMGWRTVYWTIDPIDWDPATTAQNIQDRIFGSPNLKNGAIILMHAGSLHEPDALDAVITGLQSRGFTIVPLSQLIS